MRIGQHVGIGICVCVCVCVCMCAWLLLSVELYAANIVIVKLRDCVSSQVRTEYVLPLKGNDLVKSVFW